MRGTIGIRGIRGMCTVARVYGRAGVLQPRRVGLLPTHCVTAVSRRGMSGGRARKQMHARRAPRYWTRSGLAYRPAMSTINCRKQTYKVRNWQHVTSSTASSKSDTESRMRSPDITVAGARQLMHPRNAVLLNIPSASPATAIGGLSLQGGTDRLLHDSEYYLPMAIATHPQPRAAGSVRGGPQSVANAQYGSECAPRFRPGSPRVEWGRWAPIARRGYYYQEQPASENL